jgi:hypothetical protein
VDRLEDGGLRADVRARRDTEAARVAMLRQAARIATNRVIAGVHFPIDSMVGRMLGVALGEYFLGRCGETQNFMGRKFLEGGIDAANTTDFNPFSGTQSLAGSAFYAVTSGLPAVPRSDLIKQVWDKAQAEWTNKFP